MGFHSHRNGMSIKSVVCEIQITPPLPCWTKTTDKPQAICNIRSADSSMLGGWATPAETLGPVQRLGWSAATQGPCATRESHHARSEASGEGWVQHYNRGRSHMTLGLSVPGPTGRRPPEFSFTTPPRSILCGASRTTLGGFSHEYPPPPPKGRKIEARATTRKPPPIPH